MTCQLHKLVAAHDMKKRRWRRPLSSLIIDALVFTFFWGGLLFTIFFSFLLARPLDLLCVVIEFLKNLQTEDFARAS